MAVAGFGTLPGDLDFYDRSKDETVASLRAALTVDCSWFADGRRREFQQLFTQSK